MILQALLAPNGSRRIARYAVALTGLALSCSSGRGSEGPPTVVRDTIGDTAIVRTMSGSAWGAPQVLVEEVRIGVVQGADHYMFGDVNGVAADAEGNIYVYDQHVPALRKYDAEGRYVATLGREGGGPGEYRGSDGGLTVMPDGRLALRDPDNARIQFYDRDGAPAGSWRIRGGLNTSHRLIADAQGGLYTLVLLNPDADVADWRAAMVRYGPDGAAGDTLPEPTWSYDPPRIVARNLLPSGRVGASVNRVPFTATDHAKFSPMGYWVGGVSTTYAVDLYRPDAMTLRLSRSWTPVEVRPRERANAEERATWVMRQRQPNWRWNGPPIPDTKPPFRDLFVGQDGRVWVLLHQPAVPIENVEDAGPHRRPPRRWREPVAFDVFEPDGTYLGEVHAPDGFRGGWPWPEPMFRGDRVWAVSEDAMGVQFVSRFRIEDWSGRR